MKLTGYLLLSVFAFGSFQIAAETTDKPNILLLVADDLGWNDVGYHGSEIQTPNIDWLARQGLELDRFYAQPTCSPSRAALMTGKSPVSLGIYRPINKTNKIGLPLTEKILPQYLNDAGYQSFMVGKWHLGKHKKSQLPHARGFEHFYGSLTGGIGYWDKVHGGSYDWARNGITVRETGYITHLVVDEVRTLIKSRDRSRPNFMYVAFQAPHIPNEAPQQTIDKYPDLPPKRAKHAAMVDEMDQAIGDILDTYRDAGLLTNTVVLFISDNGGALPPSVNENDQSSTQKLGRWIESTFGRPAPLAGLEFIAAYSLDGASDNAPFTGSKGSLYEGGVRVPALVWWPAVLPTGRNDSFATASDILPTLLEAIGETAAIPTDLQGISRFKAFRTGEQGTPADYVISGRQPGLALYRWPWKYIGSETPALFNIEKDPHENSNLVLSESSIASELRQALDAWPLADDPGISYLDLLFDPDGFGGEETGEPWAEQVLD